ncbi:MAG: acyl-[acyl-carrier-protein] thioesterase [Spirochaetaceae bacterium]
MKRYQEQATVRSYDTDHAGRLKPSALFNYFQEAAWRHAEMLGFGYTALLEHNLFWVISRVQLEWTEELRWGDEIIVETWPKGVTKLFALRDFIVRRADGGEAIRATSAWLTLDLESKRPRRPETIMDDTAMLENDHAIEQVPGKIAMPTDLYHTANRIARYSDLDVNRHVNNARYVDWLFDALPPRTDMAMPFSRLNVQFTGEARWNDELDVLTEVHDSIGTAYASIVNRTDDRHVCDAVLAFPRA